MRAAVAVCITLLAGCVSSTPVTRGGAAPSGPDASIPFANLGGVYDWAADGDHALYIEGIDRKWYHVELLGPCIDLPFAQRIGFVTEPGSGAFDRFSSILVRGQQCPVTRLTRSDPPPPRAKHWRGTAAGNPTHASSTSASSGGAVSDQRSPDNAGSAR